MYPIGAGTGHPIPDLLWQVYLERQRERAIEALEPTQPILRLIDPLLEIDPSERYAASEIDSSRDFDLDGLPDAQDPDDDNDGFNDNLDPAPYNASIPGTGPALGRQVDVYG